MHTVYNSVKGFINNVIFYTMTKNVHAIIKRALSKSSADFKYLSGRFREKLVTYDEGPLPRVICDQINLGCIIKKINVGEKRINESVQSDRF